jgi:hypothetical protein
VAFKKSELGVKYATRALCIEPMKEALLDQLTLSLIRKAADEGDLAEAMRAQAKLGTIRFDLVSGVSVLDGK